MPNHPSDSLIIWNGDTTQRDKDNAQVRQANSNIHIWILLYAGIWAGDPL